MALITYIVINTIIRVFYSIPIRRESLIHRMSSYRPYSIKGKVALVTGASAGIGEACAWRLAEAGCNIVLLARRADRLEVLKKSLVEAYDVQVHCVVMDVRDTNALQALPQTLPVAFQNIDILVNNAGLALGMDTTDDVNMEDATIMLDTNVKAVVALTSVVSKGMKERNSGHIINISSVAAHESYKQGGVYCATKHALDALTVAARHDFVDTDIRVTAISPGAVKTEFSVVRFKGDEKRADDVYAGIKPLTAADIADNVVYAATRPPHVQITEINVLATYQCSARGLARVLLEK
jgi:3-hydroxy acid dehydrogenase / malonic semialdehyde reductase